MHKYRSILIDYYDDVKNQVDICTENLLAESTLCDNFRKKLEETRTRYMNEIEKCLKFNINSLKNIKKVSEPFEATLFKKKFCFLLPENGDQKSIGKLILTNQWISMNVRNKFKRDRNKFNFDEELDEIEEEDSSDDDHDESVSSVDLEGDNLNVKNSYNNTSDSEDDDSDSLFYSSLIKDELLFDVLKQLIRHQNNLENVFDFTSRENNKLSNFKLNNRIENFTQKDFDSIYTLINRSRLESCTLKYRNLNNTQSILSKIPQCKSLRLNFDYNRINENILFSKNLSNLNHLEISYAIDQTLHKNFLDGLKNLKNFEIKSCRFKELATGLFRHSTNWLSLNIIDTPISGFQSSTFIGLQNLKILKLIDIKYNNDYFDSGVFKELRGLVYLEIRNNIRNFYVNDTPRIEPCLFNNYLINLECLILINNEFDYVNLDGLNLPKLRFLAIEADSLCQFKHLNLDFFHVNKMNNMINFKINGLKALSIVGTVDFEEFEKDLIELKLFILRSEGTKFYDIMISKYSTVYEFIENEMILTQASKDCLKKFAAEFIIK
ncbi:unnamed protein product [Brachionus calyciflorus]|uniref:Uncharacterized protein n=1 Tax=Brachionus calyciflorus TaxID=104777 RepID=A0A813X857_9BILA|nr:unnamed protein product [Brachionus calyciflorus]